MNGTRRRTKKGLSGRTLVKPLKVPRFSSLFGNKQQSDAGLVWQSTRNIKKAADVATMLPLFTPFDDQKMTTWQNSVGKFQWQTLPKCHDSATLVQRWCHGNATIVPRWYHFSLRSMTKKLPLCKITLANFNYKLFQSID